MSSHDSGFIPFTSNEKQGFVRIAAITLFGYEYLRTVPQEWRYIRRQIDKQRINAVFILFLLARYVGALAVIFMALAFFTTAFSDRHTCTIWIAVVRYSRALATTFCSGIIAYRA
ncbi:hypothetical protein BT69DRAFT_572868 [Atractiella rhizophila]|nr:hypothetical protein BT69DRAFT_572868 [Atractiella rhizophila]